MTEIIREGNFPKRFMHLFNCDYCGCIVKSDEYLVKQLYNCSDEQYDTVLELVCPCCGKTIYEDD